MAIRDTQDPRLAPFLNLKDAQLRRLERDGAKDFFIAESLLVVEVLLRSRLEVRAVLCGEGGWARLQEMACGEASGIRGSAFVGGQVPDANCPAALHESRIPNAESLLPPLPVFIAPQPLLESIVGFDFHRGVIACGVRPPAGDVAVLLRECTSLTILEDIHNHDNMGGLFRVVAALGGAKPGVLLSPSCIDPYYRKSLRTSIGHVLRVPFATLTPWPDALAQVCGAGFDVLGCTPDPTAEDIAAFVPRGRPAVLLGAEGPGLTKEAMARSTSRVRIGIAPGVDSLNVHVAGAIALHRLVGRNEREQA